jgi:hypothetical protein
MKNFVAKFGQFVNESRHGGTQTITITDFEFTMNGTDYICTAEVEGESEYTPSHREEGHGYHELGDFYGISNFTIVNLELAVAEGDEYVETSNPSEIEAAIAFLEKDRAFTAAVAEEFDPANLEDDAYDEYEGDFETNDELFEYGFRKRGYTNYPYKRGRNEEGDSNDDLVYFYQQEVDRMEHLDRWGNDPEHAQYKNMTPEEKAEIRERGESAKRSLAKLRRY